MTAPDQPPPEYRPAGAAVALGLFASCPRTLLMARAVLAAGGRCGAAEVCAAAWGGPAPMGRVRALVFRANKKLAGAGARWRLATDGGCVVVLC